LPEKRPPSIITAQNVDLKRAGRPIVLRARQDSWKPPEVWKCPSDETQAEKPTVRLVNMPKPVEIMRQKSAVLEVTHLQRSIRRMEAASSKIILERLKEEWMEVADASVYRELELEKQLWMLSALRSLKKSSETPMEENNGPSGMSKALSLYENHGETFYLLLTLPMLTPSSISIFPLSSYTLHRHPPPLDFPTISKILPQHSTHDCSRTDVYSPLRI
jgi:hypothetical protein